MQFKTPLAVSALALLSFACSSETKTEETPVTETVAETPAEPAAPKITAISTDRLEAMRDQIAVIDMSPDTSFLTDEERQVVNLLNEAANLMSEIYLRQVSPTNPEWRAQIVASDHPDKALLLDLFDLHFGPWDTLNESNPYIGETEKNIGAGFYPRGMTKDEFENWIAAHPEDEEAFRSGYTVIRRTEDGGLEAVPYHEEYRQWLEPAAAKLREAAAITNNENLKKFLNLRADSFLTDEYFESEMAWMDLNGTIEVAIGPYEVYTDDLFGYKTAYEAFITIKNPEESAALDKYKGMLRDMEANLPVSDSYKNFKRGFESPIAVVDQVHGGGDNVPGVQTIAFNLPNDERVREAKGAKKVLLNNVIGAKFDLILQPMAAHVLVPEQAELLTQKYMGIDVLFHELSHSLGPGTITIGGEETTVNAQLKELYSGIEEGKADVMGAYNILYMMDRGELPAAEKEQFLATYFTGLFRAMRFGTESAHAKGAAFQYSFYKDARAFSIDPDTGKYQLNFENLETAIRDLTAKVVMIQGDGSYEGARQFLAEYARLDTAANKVIESMTDLPVDIQPIYKDAL